MKIFDFHTDRSVGHMTTDFMYSVRTKVIQKLYLLMNDSSIPALVSSGEGGRKRGLAYSYLGRFCSLLLVIRNCRKAA